MLRGTSGGAYGSYIGMHESIEIRKVIGDTDVTRYEIIEKYKKLKGYSAEGG